MPIAKTAGVKTTFKVNFPCQKLSDLSNYFFIEQYQFGSIFFVIIMSETELTHLLIFSNIDQLPIAKIAGVKTTCTWPNVAILSGLHAKVAFYSGIAT